MRYPRREVGGTNMPEHVRPSGRTLIVLGALAAVIPKRLRAQSTRARRPQFQTTPQLEVPPVPAAWPSPTARLVRRATMGLTATDLASARKLGYQGWLNQQLKYTRITDGLVATAVAGLYPQLAMGVDQLYQADTGTVTSVLQQATIYRAAFSQRQLFERMVEFWSDHLNIYVGKVGYLKIVDDREVIRKHALAPAPSLIPPTPTTPPIPPT